MKKILNVLSIIVCIILTFIISIFILFYVATVSIKNIVDKDGINNIIRELNMVETLKGSEMLWNDFIKLGDDIGLSEKQLEDMLNSTKLKENLGTHIEGIIRSSLKGVQYKLSINDFKQIINIAIDEYNRVSESSITNNQRREILNSIDINIVDNLNESLESIDLVQIVGTNNSNYLQLLNNILYGHFSFVILGLIIFIIVLIALIRFSYYKWIPYVSSSLIVCALLIWGIMIILTMIPMGTIELLLPVKYLLVKNLTNSATVLAGIASGLIVMNRVLKKYIVNKNQVYISKEKIADEKAIEKWM